MFRPLRVRWGLGVIALLVKNTTGVQARMVQSYHRWWDPFRWSLIPCSCSLWYIHCSARWLLNLIHTFQYTAADTLYMPPDPPASDIRPAPGLRNWSGNAIGGTVIALFLADIAIVDRKLLGHQRAASLAKNQLPAMPSCRGRCVVIDSSICWADAQGDAAWAYCHAICGRGCVSSMHSRVHRFISCSGNLSSTLPPFWACR